MEYIPGVERDPDEIILLGPIGTHERGLPGRYFHHIDRGFGRLLGLNGGGYEPDQCVKVIFDEEPWLGEQVLTPADGLPYIAGAMHADAVADDMIRLGNAKAKSPENLMAHREQIVEAVRILSKGDIALS